MISNDGVATIQKCLVTARASNHKLLAETRDKFTKANCAREIEMYDWFLRLVEKFNDK